MLQLYAITPKKFGHNLAGLLDEMTCSIINPFGLKHLLNDKKIQDGLQRVVSVYQFCSYLFRPFELLRPVTKRSVCVCVCVCECVLRISVNRLLHVFAAQSGLQGKLRRRLPLHPLPHLRRLRHAPPLKVQPGALPQRGGLLHLPAHREEDFHPVHGDLLQRVRAHVHLRDGVPHLQAHPKESVEEEGGGQKEVRRAPRDEAAGTAAVGLQVENVRPDGPHQHGVHTEPEQHEAGGGAPRVEVKRRKRKGGRWP